MSQQEILDVCLCIQGNKATDQFSLRSTHVNIYRCILWGFLISSWRIPLIFFLTTLYLVARIVGGHDREEKAMAPHSSTLGWQIPWMEEPGRLQSMGSLRVSTTEQPHFHFSVSSIGEGNGNPLQCSCLENPRDGEPGGLPSLGMHRVRHD